MGGKILPSWCHIMGEEGKGTSPLEKKSNIFSIADRKRNEAAL